MNCFPMTLLKSKTFWFLASIPLTGLIIFGIYWIPAKLDLNSQLAELKSQGFPTTARDVDEFYKIPDGTTDTTDLWVAAIDAVQAANVSERGKSLPFIGVEGSWDVPPPDVDWAELEASRTLLTELDAEVRTIWRAAAAGGEARYPVDCSKGIHARLPHLQNARNVARLLTLAAHVAAHDDDLAQAQLDMKAIFALSDSLRREPYAISQLMRVAIHAIGLNAVEQLLPYCQFGDMELESMQSAIEAARFKDEFRWSINGERANLLTALDEMPLLLFRESNKLEALRLFTNSMEGFDAEWRDTIQRQREVSAEIKNQMHDNLSQFQLTGVLLLYPPLEQVTAAGARAEAKRRSALIAIAAQRHRLKHGELPTSLTEIDAVLLGSSVSNLMTDPFTGASLKFKSNESSIIIYSVGADEHDDGGATENVGGQGPLDFGFELRL